MESLTIFKKSVGEKDFIKATNKSVSFNVTSTVLNELIDNLGFCQVEKYMLDSGKKAGENYAYFYLELDVSIQEIFEKITETFIQNGLGRIKISMEANRHIKVYFEKGQMNCCPKEKNASMLMCEFGKNFITSILETYLNEKLVVRNYCSFFDDTYCFYCIN